MNNVIPFPTRKTEAPAEEKTAVEYHFVLADFLADGRRFSVGPLGNGCWVLNDDDRTGVALSPEALREIARHCLNLAAIVEKQEETR